MSKAPNSSAGFPGTGVTVIDTRES
jgi:hypothetical protein